MYKLIYWIPTPIACVLLSIAITVEIVRIIQLCKKHLFTKVPMKIFLVLTGFISIVLKIMMGIQPSLYQSEAVMIPLIVWFVLLLAVIIASCIIGYKRHEFTEEENKRLRAGAKIFLIFIPIRKNGSLKKVWAS